MKHKRIPESQNPLKLLLSLVFGIILAMSFLLGAMILIISAIIFHLESIRAENRGQYYLYQLPTEITSNLCTSNTVPETVLNCDTAEIQITYGQMREIAELYVSQRLSYNEISEIIGDYEVSCSLAGDISNVDVFRCLYQLDVSFKLIFVFSSDEEALIRIE